MEQSLLKADIFFFVSTIALVILSGILVIGLFYIIGIVRSIKRIVKTVEDGADTVVSGIKTARENLEEEGVVGSILDIFKKISRAQKTRKK